MEHSDDDDLYVNDVDFGDGNDLHGNDVDVGNDDVVKSITFRFLTERAAYGVSGRHGGQVSNSCISLTMCFLQRCHAYTWLAFNRHWCLFIMLISTLSHPDTLNGNALIAWRFIAL